MCEWDLSNFSIFNSIRTFVMVLYSLLCDLLNVDEINIWNKNKLNSLKKKKKSFPRSFICTRFFFFFLLITYDEKQNDFNLSTTWPCVVIKRFYNCDQSPADSISYFSFYSFDQNHSNTPSNCQADKTTHDWARYTNVLVCNIAVFLF